MEESLYVFSRPATMGSIWMVCAVAFAIAASLLLVFLLMRHRLAKAHMLTQYMELYHDYAKKYYDQALRQNQLACILRHDLKNHLQTVQLLLNDGKADKAEEYLAQMQQRMRATAQDFEADTDGLTQLLRPYCEAAEKDGKRLDITQIENCMAVTAAVFITDVIEIALAQAEAGSTVTVLPAPDEKQGFCVQYKGGLTKTRRTRWAALAKLVRADNGCAAAEHRPPHTVLTVWFGQDAPRPDAARKEQRPC